MGRRRRPKKNTVGKREGEAKNSAVHVLPNELILDILSRLTAKDVLRFKCVSKSWYASISDPYFAKKHLERTTTHDTESNTNTNISLILRYKYNSRLLYKVDFGDNDVVSRYTPVNLGEGSFKFQKPYYHRLVGSCNGLVCLSDDARFFAIWNPSTGESHELQRLPNKRLPITSRDLPLAKGSFNSIIRGFGHDRFSDDYKVVEILHIYRNDNTLLDAEARVYSLKAKSWDRRKSLDFPSHQMHSHSGTFLPSSNALHWVIRKMQEADPINGNYIIAAFDLGGEVDNEEYHEVQQPDDKFKFRDVSSSLGVLRGCLCIRSISSISSIDMWIMKEYGVKESWTWLISIADPCPSSWSRWSYTMIPLAYSRCGNKILLKEDPFRRLIWYDLTTKEITMAKLAGLKDRCIGLVCLQTLVRVVNGDIELKKAATAQHQALLDRQEKEDMHI